MVTTYGTELDSSAPIPGYCITGEIISPGSIRINSDAVVGDTVAYDAVVTTRSFGMDTVVAVI